MCGIFAVSGLKKNAGTTVLEGLKKLEYRGYDSWGICVYENGNFIQLEKEVGKISQAQKEFKPGTEAIGHSRWATHGGVTKANAHPHRVGKITLVHNGIFENYQEEKDKFTEKFHSDTDSEVIAALINKNLEAGEPVKEAIQKAAKKIQGRFAILVFVDGEMGIYAARKGSPLIIGRKNDETFIASDIPAFLAETNVVNYIDDNEMVYISGGEATFSCLETGEPREKRDITVKWNVEEAEKGDYEHFMIKEIFDQKDTISRAINQDDANLIKSVELLQSSRGVYIIGCGTAHKAAMEAEYYFAEISKRKINVVPASEMPYFENFVQEGTALVAVSQSGETADVLEILEQGKKKGAKILSLTNVESSSIARLSDVHLPINAGPEKAVASTKALTSQMALLFLLAHADGDSINIGRQSLSSAAGNVNDLLNPRYEDHIRKIAEKIVDYGNLFIIGRGELYPMAMEAAIKIQEVSYIHAHGFAAGELKHGPIALIETRTPCIVLGGDQETISNATELKARGARIIGVAPKNNIIFDEWIRVPDADGAQGIVTIVPVQILAYHLAVLRGLDPDMPRNLAKSVTVK